MQVEIDSLCKAFGRQKAVDQVTFSFCSGQIFGFVGPNGAGKTTTMKIMATLEEPDSGDVRFDGVSAIQYPEKIHRLIGYMPDSLPAYRDMNVREYLDFFARSFQLRGQHRRDMVEQVEEFTNLAGIRHKTLNSLSKGMKQRVSLARALIHDPPILIMDEPAAGLDPRARIELRELLKAVAEQGKGILISSHILTELEELIHGAVIIEHGRILKAGTLDEIVSDSSVHRTILVRVMGDDVEELHRAVLEYPGVENSRVAGSDVVLELMGDDELCAGLLKHLVYRGLPVLEYRQERADLEEIFMRITKGVVQ